MLPLSRHVCNSVELPPSSVHVSNSGATSLSGGCSVSGMAGEVNVHVSSIPSAQQSHSEALVHPGGRGSSHSPLVAQSVVVSTPTSSLCGTPPGLSLPSRSSIPTGSEVCLGRKVTWRLSCDTIKVAGFSDEVSRLAAAPRSTPVSVEDYTTAAHLVHKIRTARTPPCEQKRYHYRQIRKNQ